MKYKIRGILNPHQKELFNDDVSSLLHLSGGYGSGKTHGLVKKLLKLSFLNKDLHGGLVCPTYKDFKRDVHIEFENILNNNNIKCKYNNQDHYYSFPWTKGRLYVASAENPLRGPNWAYAGINEVTLIPLKRYKEVIGRCRLKQASCLQVVSVGTPEGFLSEYYEYFIEKPPTNFKIIYGKTDDNAQNVHENYTSNLEQSYDEKSLAAYRHGLWVNMNGAQFYYAFNPAKQFNRDLKPEMFDFFHIGLDQNIDPYCASIWGFDGHKIYGVGQIKLEGDKGYDTKNMLEALRVRGYTPDNSILYPDPSGIARSTRGQPDITVMKNAGYQVKHKSKAPPYRQRQLNVNNLMDKSRIIMNPDLMPDVRKDFEAVEQDKVTLEKKKDNPKLTHFSDGVDYLCDWLFPFSGQHKSVTIERYR